MAATAASTYRLYPHRIRSASSTTAWRSADVNLNWTFTSTASCGRVPGSVAAGQYASSAATTATVTDTSRRRHHADKASDVACCSMAVDFTRSGNTLGRPR